MIAPFYISTSNVQWFQSSASSPTLAIIYLILAILVGAKVVSCCGFDLYFPEDLGHEKLCMCLLATLRPSLEKCLIYSLFFFISIICYSGLRLLFHLLPLM